MPQTLHTEEELFASFQKGDERVLATYYERYYSLLTHYCTAITANPEAAGEIVGEAFVKLWNNRTCIERFEKIKPFLYRIVYNASVDALRKQKTVRKKEAAYLRQVEQTTFSQAERSYEYMIEAETYERLYRSLETLAPRTQEVLHLFYYQNKSIKDIASLLGVSVNTVKTLKLRGLQQLRGSHLTLIMILLFVSLFFSL